jgi:short-chain fatty acids transporter
MIATRIETLFRKYLPNPMTIALLLTGISAVLAWLWAPLPEARTAGFVLQVFRWWEGGLWNAGLLAFLVQMALILVLGHILALSPPVAKGIQLLTQPCTTTVKAVIRISIFTMLVGYFNWGLGLVFGAIFARSVGDYARQKGLSLHYPLVGAAGYTGMLVWHGGLSGSAPLKAAEKGHLQTFLNSESTYVGPLEIGLSETLFSPMNVAGFFATMIVIPIVLWWMASQKAAQSVQVPKGSRTPIDDPAAIPAIGAEKLDAAPWFGRGIGAAILLLVIWSFWGSDKSLYYITPNDVNIVLLALGLLLHPGIRSFLLALESAIGGAAGILIQFPLYFGIIGIMRDSGLVSAAATAISAYATPESFPVITYLSAAVINIFIPSGGGQWSIQAPILIETAARLQIPLGKCIMALAYGDQLTNMLQPFWALPLLGITGLKAREILPYTLLLMLAAGGLFLVLLLLF